MNIILYVYFAHGHIRVYGYATLIEIFKSWYLWFTRKLTFYKKLIEVFLFMGDTIILNNIHFDFIMFHSKYSNPDIFSSEES